MMMKSANVCDNEVSVQQGKRNCAENVIAARHERGCKFCRKNFATFAEVKESQKTDSLVADKFELIKDSYENNIKNLKIKIYRTIILPVVLYGCEAWSLTLREERRLKVFESRVLRRVLGPRRDEVGNGENYIMRSLMICTPYTILCGW
jgi:hypothetical protein